jgi:secreted PhoX family phosphatase
LILTRRHFLRNAAAASVAFSSVKHMGCGGGSSNPTIPTGYGDLVPDPEGIMDLPSGFSYRVISQFGDPMDDGLVVPSLCDGMAAFPGADGRTILVRNHELFNATPNLGPFGPNNELLDRVDASKLYDAGVARPALGGTSTLVYDTRSGRLERQFLSLSGTARNCAGGPTPWGTWITCEEFPAKAGAEYTRDHGFNFEVPADPESGLVQAIPLVAMGRFNHEAIAVDPRSGIILETEDRPDGLLYRFLPDERGNPAAGGRLQALAVRGEPGFDTRNWLEERVAVGAKLTVSWVDLEEPESPQDDLRFQGAAKGAALFSRGEGLWTGRDGIYVACTSGGRQIDEAVGGRGQIWRYVPSPNEGQSGEAGAPATLELLFEPNDVASLDKVDNITVAPWGDLLICEDGDSDVDYIVGLRPTGESYKFARNVLDQSEFAGATFSPDGTTLFVNYQFSGRTFAITGPWHPPIG